MDLKKAVASAVCALAGSCAVAGQFEWYDGKWPHESCDVKPDEKVVFGKLSNGFRYAVIPNSNPAGRVTMYLDVQVGSLMEEPHESGVAHFLEHMAFNGSKNFTAGELIPFFQRNGMNFGGDTNAHTSLHETVYKLNLADVSDATVGDGLKVLRDVADGLDLDAYEINRERGVIFAEKKARENEAVHAARDWKKFLYGTSRLSGDVIGTDATLEGIDDRIMRGFYEKWYVPGRMVLAVAGDVDPAKIAPMIEKAFGSMKETPLPPVSDFGEVERAGIKALVQKRPVTHTSVAVTIMHPEAHLGDGMTAQRVRIVDSLVDVIVRKRLLAVKERSDGIWTSAYFRNSWRSSLYPSVMLTANTTDRQWKAALEELYAQIRRVREYGFSAGELAEAKADLEKALKRSISQASALTNEDHARAFVRAENADLVFTSAEEDLRIYQIFRDSITLREVNAAAREAFAPENRRILVSGNMDASEFGVLKLWTSFDGKRYGDVARQTSVKFPYLAMQKPANVPEPVSYHIPSAPAGVVAHQVEFSENFRAVFLQLPFEKGTVTANLYFGDGICGLTDENSKIARMSVSTLAENGVGKLGMLQSSRLFGAKGLAVRESIGTRYNTISGSSQTDDLGLLIEAVHTQFADPHIIGKNRRRVLTEIRQSEYRRDKTVGAVAKQLRFAYYTGERMRNMPLQFDAADSVTVDGMQVYVRDSRSRGGRVLVVAGDFDLQKAVEKTASLFLSMRQVESQPRDNGADALFPEGRFEIRTVGEDTDSKAVVSMAWFAPLEDLSDRKTLSARSVLASIVRDRMRVRLREEMGASYSPFALYRRYDNEDGFGFLMLETETSKDMVDSVRRVMNAIVDDIRRRGVNADELERQIRPRLTALATARGRNVYWENCMTEEFLYDRPCLTWAGRSAEILKGLTPADISEQAARVFAGKSAGFVVQSR